MTEYGDPVSEREVLLHAIQLARLSGGFRLSSGQAASEYLDLRTVTMHLHGSLLVGRLLRELVRDWMFDAVGGMTLGADPVALAVMYADGPQVTAFSVRKEPKAHGTGRRIEGPDVMGRSVLVVDDTATTGASILAAADAVRERGGAVAGIATVVDRGAASAVAEAGLAYRSIFSWDDVGNGRND